MLIAARTNYEKVICKVRQMQNEAEKLVEIAARKEAENKPCPVCNSCEKEFLNVNMNERGNTGILVYFGCLTCKRKLVLFDSGEFELSRG